MKPIYLAGPLFSVGERAHLERVAEALARALGIDPVRDVFVPHRDAGDVGLAGTREDVFAADVRAIDEARLLVAVLDGADVDSGTAVEIGYAYARGKRVLGLLTDFRALGYGHAGPGLPEPGRLRLNNMIWGACGSGRDLYTTVEALAEDLRAEGHQAVRFSQS